jgi:hypothetical protein
MNELSRDAMGLLGRLPVEADVTEEWSDAAREASAEARRKAGHDKGEGPSSKAMKGAGESSKSAMAMTKATDLAEQNHWGKAEGHNSHLAGLHVMAGDHHDQAAMEHADAGIKAYHEKMSEAHYNRAKELGAKGIA